MRKHPSIAAVTNEILWFGLIESTVPMDFPNDCLGCVRCCLAGENNSILADGFAIKQHLRGVKGVELGALLETHLTTITPEQAKTWHEQGVGADRTIISKCYVLVTPPGLFRVRDCPKGCRAWWASSSISSRKGMQRSTLYKVSLVPFRTAMYGLLPILSRLGERLVDSKTLLMNVKV